MKNLEDAVIGLKTKAKSAPTPAARLGGFIGDYNDLILQNADSPEQLRALVGVMNAQKQGFVDTITHV